MTRVLLVSTSYPQTAADWRGIFMRHMVAALARLAQVEISVWAPPGELPEGVSNIVPSADARWLAQLMADGGISHMMRSGGWRGWFAPLRLFRMLAAGYRGYPEVDVYHINWLQCALPLPRNAKPALITVLGNDLKLLKLPLMQLLMRRVMKHRKVIICPNADWMAAPLQQAFGDVAKIQPVSFGIDPTWYAVNREYDQQAKRWLAVTRLTADKLGSLFDWSKAFFVDGSRELHLFGPMQEGIDVPEWVHYHGSATPEQLVTEWFPTACGLVTLSRHAEGRPQVMLEAMAAGLPIIASDMPAHATLVCEGSTGRLCASADAYGHALAELEDAEINRQMGKAARQWVAKEMGTWDDCAVRYANIYRELLGRA